MIQRVLHVWAPLLLATFLEAQQAPVRPDTVAGRGAAADSAVTPRRGRRDFPKEIVLQRETFAYAAGGRRDPFGSLMSSSEVRPLISDLDLAVVALDPTGGTNSLAVLRDLYSKKQYRVRVGQQLGRLRVTAIRPRAVVFTVQEFGFNRQETLALRRDTTKTMRKP